MDFLKTIWGHVKEVFNWCASWLETYPKVALTIILLLAASHLFR